MTAREIERGVEHGMAAGLLLFLCACCLAPRGGCNVHMESETRACAESCATSGMASYDGHECRCLGAP